MPEAVENGRVHLEQAVDLVFVGEPVLNHPGDLRIVLAFVDLAFHDRRFDEHGLPLPGGDLEPFELRHPRLDHFFERVFRLCVFGERVRQRGEPPFRVAVGLVGKADRRRVLGRFLNVGNGHVEIVRQSLIDLLFRPAFGDGDPYFRGLATEQGRQSARRRHSLLQLVHAGLDLALRPLVVVVGVDEGLCVGDDTLFL